MDATSELRVERRDGDWVLAGAGRSEDLRLCHGYLGHLADRNYAAGTRRSYAFDLLAFARWLAEYDIALDAVDADALLRFLASCRSEGLAPASTNRRMAAISGLFAFRSMRDPSQASPMPRSATARRAIGLPAAGAVGASGSAAA